VGNAHHESELIRLVDPALRVGACGGGFEHVANHERQDSLVEVEALALVPLGQCSGVAVGLAWAEVEGGVGMRVARLLEVVFKQMDRVVEEEAIGFYALAADRIGCLPESPLADTVRRGVMNGMKRTANFSENES